MKYLLVQKYRIKKKNGKLSKEFETYYRGTFKVMGFGFTDCSNASDAKRFDTEAEARAVAVKIGWKNIRIQKAH